MDDLKQKIDDSRNLKPKSLVQYMTHIKRLYKEVADSKGDILESLADEDKVTDFLKKTFQDATIRSYLASVIVALSTDKEEYKKELEIYNDILVDMNEDYKKLMKDGTRTDRQKRIGLIGKIY